MSAAEPCTAPGAQLVLDDAREKVPDELAPAFKTWFSRKIPAEEIAGGSQYR